MDFEIWPPEPITEKVFLRLQHNAGGGIELVAVDANGDKYLRCLILEITKDGVIRLSSSCKVEGIQTDAEGFPEVKFVR